MVAGGLVQVAHFSVLPDVGAGVASLAVLASMAALMVSVWRQPDPTRFAWCMALASLNRCWPFDGIVVHAFLHLFSHACPLLLAYPLAPSRAILPTCQKFSNQLHV